MFKSHCFIAVCVNNLSRLNNRREKRAHSEKYGLIFPNLSPSLIKYFQASKKTKTPEQPFWRIISYYQTKSQKKEGKCQKKQSKTREPCNLSETLAISDGI